jgi:hypothetical protein
VRRIHHADIGAAIDERFHQLLLEADQRTHSHVGRKRRKHRQPAQQQVFPQADPAADRDGGAIAADHADLLARLLDRSRQQRGVLLKLLPGRRQRGPRLVANEEFRTKRFLQPLDPGADGRLRDMQTLGGLHEAACGDDDQECAGEFGIHRNARYITRIFIACKREEQS